MSRLNLPGLMVMTMLLTFFACQPGVKKNKPSIVNFDRKVSVDYSNPENWAALPGKKDMADIVPSKSDFSDGQDDAKVDVFYVHPTTYYQGDNWNADLSDEKINKNTDTKPIKYQASIFNGSCRIYAPRYRQAHLHAFYAHSKAGDKALWDANKDVKAAFQYYLDNYNNERPIVIASHSQGTAHMRELMKEFFDGTELQNRLVAAYLVGFPVFEDRYESLKPCESADQTNCYLSWNTYIWDYIPAGYDTFFKGSVVVNPLDWTREKKESEIGLHKGMVSFGFSKVHEQSVQTKVADGLLYIKKPDIPGKRLLNWDSYHIADYNLFYADVRENVKTRIEAYFKK